MHDKTREILNLFETINTIPRCSKNEDKIAQWLQRWANDREFGVQKDSAGNIKIKVPARQTAGQQAGIIIQGHMDMVCEKTDESDHDFSSDPVRCVYDGDWLRSEKTSLGADNGIAIALALSVADDPGVAHPPLELLFTVDEESGLLGAKAMEPGFLDGDILLNVDSEEDGIFTIGCAGGEETRISLPTNFATLSKNNGVYKIAATGIRGGHSGIDIHKQRASANKILARALQAMEVQNDMHLISIKGGTTHNAIARDAEASVAFQPSHYHRLQEVIKEFERTVRHEYARTETSISVPL
ncbi:MAG: beta-Ala-His dipeptidase, partial [Desulfobacterales bacterium]